MGVDHRGGQRRLAEPRADFIDVHGCILDEVGRFGGSFQDRNILGNLAEHDFITSGRGHE